MPNNTRYARRRVDDIFYKPMLGEVMIYRLWRTFRLAFFMGDTSTVRAIMMIASLMQAIGFLLPLGTMERPYFSDMRFLPGWVWGCAYILHMLGVMWRFVDLKNNEIAGYIVNGYGVSLWLLTTILGTLAARTYTPSTAMEWTVLAAAIGALLRTGDKADRLSA